MSLVQIRWRPGPGELRKFGVVVIIGLALIGLALQFFMGHPRSAWVLYGAAALLGLPALTGTRAALPGYWLWMGVAFVVGNIMGRVLLSAVYYGLITPMGLGRRAVSDRLSLRRRRVDTYWTDIESKDESARYERLF
jgi:hypothetical protein